MPHLFYQYSNMRYDKNGLPVKEYYTEELKKPPKEKMKALEYQKYYTGGSIILMFVVLFAMYLVLSWLNYSKYKNNLKYLFDLLNLIFLI